MTNTIDLVEAGNAAFAEGTLEGIDIEIEGARLTKRAHTDLETYFLRNEARFLRALSGSKFAPELIDEGDDYINMEYLGKSEAVTDEIVFRRECARLLCVLNAHRIRHGDITTKNVVVKDNRLMLTDFHQSKYRGEPGPDKRPEGDAHWLWKTAGVLSPDRSRHIRKWQAIRPHLTPGGVLVAAGCSEADYLLMATGEGVSLSMYGIERNAITAEQAHRLSGQFILCADLCQMDHEKCDDTFFMSVYAHIAKEHGQAQADQVLTTLVEKSNQLFFETQLTGDGPGVHATDDDVYKMLKAHGKVDKLTTIPVYGRDPFARSIWRVY